MRSCSAQGVVGVRVTTVAATDAPMDDAAGVASAVGSAVGSAVDVVLQQCAIRVG